MGASHVIDLTIINNTGSDLSYSRDWFDSGRLADNQVWPTTILNGETKTIQCREKSLSPVGCSGYVIYQSGGQDLAIAFSNPSVGSNKLGFGSDGDATWDDMGSHDYLPFADNCVNAFTGFGSCTGSTVNNALLRITPFANFPASSKSHVINLAIFNNSQFDLIFDSEWFDTGRVADNQSWPPKISKGEVGTVQCSESDWSAVGCSGYVVYKCDGDDVAIAFSNPSVGWNKLGFGDNGKATWDDMDDHSYKPFTDGISKTLIGFGSCTGSDTNFALACIALETKSWMDGISGEKELYELSIPGTHDSGAIHYYGTFSKCQYYGIKDQLNLGIRFLDIRCDVSNGEFYIYHGPISQLTSFEEVLNEVVKFLDDNKSETIIMSLKNEGSNPDFYKIFVNKYYQNSNYNPFFFVENRIPKLKEVRKKIVLLRRFDSNGISSPVGIDAVTGWKDNNSLFELNKAAPLVVQDLYHPATDGDKEKAIKNLFNLENSYNNKLMLNFSSGYTGTPTPNGPENLAIKINPIMLNFLREKPSLRRGVVIMDFPIYELEILPNYTSALIPTIIKSN